MRHISLGERGWIGCALTSANRAIDVPELTIETKGLIDRMESLFLILGYGCTDARTKHCTMHFTEPEHRGRFPFPSVFLGFGWCLLKQASQLGMLHDYG